jgi:hypothetical protein
VASGKPKFKVSFASNGFFGQAGKFHDDPRSALQDFMAKNNFKPLSKRDKKSKYRHFGFRAKTVQSTLTAVLNSVAQERTQAKRKQAPATEVANMKAQKGIRTQSQGGQDTGDVSANSMPPTWLCNSRKKLRNGGC